jgi:hypothetical protein
MVDHKHAGAALGKRLIELAGSVARHDAQRSALGTTSLAVACCG